MALPFAEPCGRGIIAAQPCPRELGREIAPERRRMVLAVNFPEGMQILGPRRFEQAVPDVGADPQDAGESRVGTAKAHGAHESAEVGAPPAFVGEAMARWVSAAGGGVPSLGHRL